MYTCEIVCLANSRKPPSGRCIAGKEIAGARVGTWVRPVSSREGKEVSEEERRYQDGRRADLLDIVRVPLQSPEPAGHQVENALLDAGYYWEKIGEATWGQVNSLVDPYDQNFWVAGEHTRYGLNDKISALVAGGINSSLKLICPQNLTLQVIMEQGFDGAQDRKRVRAEFRYQGQSYNLIVTDPVVEQDFLARDVGSYPIQEAVLCISLAEVWVSNGYASRLVAAVITPDRCT